jgi:phytoene synthase
VQDHLSQRPDLVLKQNGKSFHFAGLALGAKRLGPISQLYAVCRYIDDCADENTLPEAKRLIAEVKNQMNKAVADLSSQAPTPRDRFEQLVQNLIQQGVDPQNLNELVKGAEFDLDQTRIQDLRTLLDYCYLVAGVVGLMMCPLLGATALKAKKYAIDLGIGMQLTNICRDVLADFRNNRIYLPELESLGEDFIKSQHSSALKAIVKKYLDLADQYYWSGYQGLSYLPFRSRVAILLAGEVYRHIGEKIRRQDYDVLQGRTVLSLAEKVRVAFFSLRFLFKKCFWIPSPHREVFNPAMPDPMFSMKMMEKS